MKFCNHRKVSLRIILLIIPFVILSTSPSIAQLNEVTSQAALAEKIYLQLDSKVYTTDKTIWFKCIVTYAVDHTPSKLSGVLYVELIGPNERVIEKRLIKLHNGIGDGYFDLNQSYREGQYMVRAYTEWNKNFDTDFVSKEYIQVFQPSERTKTSPISNIIVTNIPNIPSRISAGFDPILIDSLHSKELKIIVSLDNKKDTLSVKKNSNGKYLLDYVVPPKCQLVNLQMLTKNGYRYSKTIVMNEDYLDLQFFPESGELVQGLSCKVGFKALDFKGKGKLVEGEIIDVHNNILTTFRSNSLGMGSFMLNKVDSTCKYVARIKSNPATIYPLPSVAQKGNILSVTKAEDEIQLTALSNYLNSDSIFIRISCRGLVYFDIKGRMKEGNLVYLLPALNLPEGIIAFTLMDKWKQPVAERLFFNENPLNRINITLSTDKESYLQREQTRLNIETSNNNGEPLNANLSLLVLNKDEMGGMQDLRQNILSYFLLSSDLKGEIETPGYYFGKETDRQNDLDCLLLTQGWRKYLYTKPVNKFIFQPEKQNTLSGMVGGVIFEKRKMKKIRLTLMTFGTEKTIQVQATDSLGRFKFNLADEFGQNLNVLIQSANKSGINKEYTIMLDKKDAPAISFLHDISAEKPDSVVRKIVEGNIDRKRVDDRFPLSSGDIHLKEVVVNAYKMTPQRKIVTEEYGKADDVIAGKEIQAKEEKWSYGLYSVLMFNFPDKVRINRDSAGNLNASIINSEKTLVVIDGIPLKEWEYPMIQNIPPSDVSSFEIIKHPKNFSRLYIDAYPEENPMNAPSWGSIIAIYTMSGKGIYGTKRAVGIMRTSVPVFSTPREFYAPKYENILSSDWIKPDLRALVHWTPEIISNSGKASTTFYNADNIGKMQVVVEAISETGKIGYKELVYDVKKNPENQNRGLNK